MSKLGGKNPLEAVIMKGQLEDEVKVSGNKVIMHISTVSEEREVNNATTNVNLMDRDYERWVHRLARVVTKIDSHIFEDSNEALDFFVQLTQPHLEQFVEAYGKMFQSVNASLGEKAEEIKNK